MKKHIICLLVSCALVPISRAQLNCDADSTGLISLVDLQEDTYMGYQGGLYPGGDNEMPATHRLAGSNAAKNIKPLDTLGNVDLVNGKIVFLGLGASTAGNTWNNFKDLVEDEPGLNPCLQIVNGCQGAKGLEIMIDTLNYPWYWTDLVFTKMQAKGATPAQVQAIWMRTASKADTVVEFPLFPNGIADKFEILLPILLEKFPNLKQVYISVFFYGGYADSSKAFYDIVAEPGSYFTNYAVKWVVERQINGDPDLVYAGPEKKAPWVAWGPHTWADGMRANDYDGLFWNCEEDFQEDGGGYHLTTTGKIKDAQLILDWAKNNPVTMKWFLDGPKWNSCDPSGRMANGEVPDNSPTVTKEGIMLYPSPNNGIFNVKLNHGFKGFADIRIVNSFGQVVYANQVDAWNAIGNVSVDLGEVANGLYIMHLNLNGTATSREFVVSR